MPLYSDTGLTFSPQTSPASPAVNTLRAALMSRSWLTPHSGHVQSRISKPMLPTICPQSLHRLLEGYQRSMPISVRPYHFALYSSCRTNSDQPESPIDLARQWFFCILLTARVSTAITWFSLISRVESLCRKSLRVSSIFACSRATFSLALARFFVVLSLLWFIRRCSLARLLSFFRNAFGEAIFSPVERIAKWVRPRSIPTRPLAFFFGAMASSQSIDTKYRPTVSLDMVQVVTLAAFGMERDQRMFSGSSIFAKL